MGGLLLLTMVPVALGAILGAKSLAPRLAGRHVPGRFIMRMPTALAGLVVAGPFLLGIFLGAVLGAIVNDALGVRDGTAAYDLAMGAGVGLGLGLPVGHLVLLGERYDRDRKLRPMATSLRMKPGQEPRKLDLPLLVTVGFVSLLMVLAGSMADGMRVAGAFLAPFLASVLTILVFAQWDNDSVEFALARKVPDWLLALSVAALVGAFAFALADEPRLFLHMGWKPFAIAAILPVGAAVRHFMATRPAPDA